MSFARLLLLSCVVRLCESAPGVDSLTAWREELVLSSADTRLRTRTVAHVVSVLSLRLSEPWRLQRGDSNSFSQLDTNAVFPEESELSLDGLLRLRCPAASPTLITPSMSSRDPLHRILALLFGTRDPQELMFAVLDARPDLSSCQLAVLQPSEQDPSRPSKQLVGLASGVPLRGVFELPNSVEWRDRLAQAAANASRSDLELLPLLSAEHLLRVNDCLGSSSAADSVAGEPNGALLRCANPGKSYNAAAVRSAEVAGSEADRDGGASLIGLGSRTRVSARKAFGGMIKGAMSSVIGPVIDIAGGMVGDTLGDLLGEWMGKTMEQGLVDVIPDLLKDQMLAPVGNVLVPSMVITVADTLPPAIARKLRDYLVNVLPEKITKELTKKLGESLMKTIPAKVEKVASAKLQLELTNTLGHVLTRSLTHTLVPALVHSVTHSPLMDFYCYYCKTHKLYCSYCRPAPLQAYYAEYYAGFYSTYDADYYTQYFADQLAQEQRAAPLYALQALADTDFQIVLEAPGEGEGEGEGEGAAAAGAAGGSNPPAAGGPAAGAGSGAQGSAAAQPPAAGDQSGLFVPEP